MSANCHFPNRKFMLLRFALPSFMLLFSFLAQSQSMIYSYTFDSNVQGWETQSLSNSGYWIWSQNGKADQGTYWNDRPSIDESNNGAMVYDGDYIINSNQGDSTSSYHTALLSPRMDFSSYAQVYIKFNQYFRNYDSKTSLEVSSDLGASWHTIALNVGVNRNVETSPKDYEIIDISAYAAQEKRVHVRFLIGGKYYFWILDDVFFYDSYPVVPTFPAFIGEYLTEHGYPYEVDETGWPYIPDEAIVNFAPGTPQSVKDQLREEVGAIVKESCVCNTLETWQFLDNLLEGPIGLSGTGETTGADEQISTSTSESEIDDIDFNKYVKGELTEGSFVQANIKEILSAHKPPKDKNPLKVAIIDTGVDILHKKLDPFLYLSNEIPYNEVDDDENCYPDNYVGWNFVDDNNNASDDHGHGSHVAGIVAQYSKLSDKKQTVQIIPYKTHDFRGLANLFDVTCAMYQSVKDKVSVVNCSWGFYGNESPVLKTAIIHAYKNKITVVAASGNDSLYLEDEQQYPACYKLPNLISVGSYNLDDKDHTVVNSQFSNYGSKFVDVLASGVDVFSTIPYNDFMHKTGTSMAAPNVAGRAVQKYLAGYIDPEMVKNAILEDAQDHEHLLFEVLDGNVLLENSDSDTEDRGIANISKFQSSNNQNGQIRADSKIAITKMNREIAVEFFEQYNNVSIYISNIQGQILKSQNLKNIRKGGIEMIPTDGLPTGLYFLRVNEKVYEFAVY